MEGDNPEFYNIVEKHGDNLDHLALEYQHRHRDDPRVIDPNVPPLPFVEEQVGWQLNEVPTGLF